MELSDDIEPEASERYARIAEAVRSVPRHHFAAPKLQHRAYQSADRSLSEWQGIPPVRVTVQLVEALEVGPSSRVLEFGTGLGFTAAVLGELVDTVFTVCRTSDRVSDARTRLNMLGMGNVTVLQSNDYKTELSDEDIDAILVSEVNPKPPKSLLEMLNPGGKVVMLGEREDDELALIRVTRRADGSVDREVIGRVRYSFLLGDIVVDIEAATHEEVERAAERASGDGHPIGQVLLEEGAVTEDELYRAIALQHGLNRGDLEELASRANPNLAARVPDDTLQHRQVLPIRRSGERVKLATVDPHPPRRYLRRLFGAQKLDVRLVAPSEFRSLWESLGLGDLSKWASADPQSYGEEGIRPEVDVYNARMRDRFNGMLRAAQEADATAVHIERAEEGARVRYRVDGRLRDVESHRLSDPEFERLRDIMHIQAGLGSDGTEVPAAGRFHRLEQSGDVEYELHTFPSASGVEYVIHMPLRPRHLRSVADLGLSEWQTDRFREHVAEPSGLVIVAGPGGSGRTTTLYAGVREAVERPGRKVAMLEDSAVYDIDGVTQLERPGAPDLPPGDRVAHLARRDADVLVIDELDGPEMTREVAEATRRGHLVMAALAACDPVDVFRQLHHWGLSTEHLADAVAGVFVQRLVRTNCSACAEPVEPDPTAVERVFEDGLPDDLVPRAGRGCEACGGDGISGRMAVFAHLPMHAESRRAVAELEPGPELGRRLRNSGMTTFRESMLREVREGRVAVESVPGVLRRRHRASELDQDG